MQEVDSFLQSAIKVFSLDEGRSAVPYKDSGGYWTIGVGHLIGKNLSELRFSENQINETLKEDIQIAVADSMLLVGHEAFNKLSDARKIAITSLLFTLGRTKFEKFKETLEAIRTGNWAVAAERILNTKWARDVDPRQRPGIGRDDRIAYMLKTGEFHPDYGV